MRSKQRTPRGPSQNYTAQLDAPTNDNLSGLPCGYSLLKYMADWVLHAPHPSSAMRFITAARDIESLLVNKERRTLACALVLSVLETGQAIQCPTALTACLSWHASIR